MEYYRLDIRRIFSLEDYSLYSGENFKESGTFARLFSWYHWCGNLDENDDNLFFDFPLLPPLYHRMHNDYIRTHEEVGAYVQATRSRIDSTMKKKRRAWPRFRDIARSTTRGVVSCIIPLLFFTKKAKALSPRSHSRSTTVSQFLYLFNLL